VHRIGHHVDPHHVGSASLQSSIKAHVHPFIFQQSICLFASMSKDDATWALHFEKAGPGQVL
jgi:hypothetical protein